MVLQALSATGDSQPKTAFGTRNHEQPIADKANELVTLSDLSIGGGKPSFVAGAR